MAGSEKSGNTWYALKNIAMALLFMALSGIVGPLSTLAGAVAVFILGISIIFRGISSFGETSFVVSLAVVILGGGLIAAASKLNEYVWFEKASACLSAAFIAWLGYRQRKKSREPYGRDTRFAGRLKVLAKLLYISIFIGGLVIFAATVLDIFSALQQLSMTLKSVGFALCLAGSVMWLMHTSFTLKALKESGNTVNGFKNGTNGAPRRRPVQNHAEGADEGKVRSEMQSLANYFTGGYDYPHSGYSDCKIDYSVTVTVGKGEIKFYLRCALSGTYPQSAEKAVQSNVTSMIQKRQKLILNKAEDRLNSIDPDRDYMITVNLSVS